MLDRLGREAFINRASFGPASIFAGGLKGAYWDVFSRGTLFQDTAGTSPVTTAGQSVARINDLSPNAVNLSQATALSQPTFQIDGAGRPYLAFDGVNDFYSTAGIDLTGIGSATFWAAGYATSDAAFGVVMEYGPTLSTTAGFAIWQPPSAASTSIQSQHRGATATSGVARPKSAAPADWLAIGTSDLAAPAINIIVNTATGANGTTATGGGFYGPNTLYIGSRAGTGSWWPGRLYAFGVVQGIMSTDNIAALQAMLNARAASYA